MKRILYLSRYLIVSLTCVIVFMSCVSQDEKSYDMLNNQNPHGYTIIRDDINLSEPPLWIDEHPWRTHYNIEVMPAFRNHFHMIPAEYAQHEGLSANMLSIEEMTSAAENIIIAMGLEVEQVEETQPWFWTVGGITAKSRNVEVTVEANGVTHVVFTDGFPLPDGMVFPRYFIPEELSRYLREKFAPALGVQIREFENNNDDIVDRILDFHFNSIWFILNEDGKLDTIQREPLIGVMLSDKIGYFPIITYDEAIERMLADQGEWPFRIEHEALPTRDDIIDIRLVYFGHAFGRNHLEEFAPWYNIIFISPVWNDIMSYFVPAIRADYLEANPAWSVFPHQ